MISQHFGRPNDEFGGLIDFLEKRGDELLAQSIYDTRTSSLFASASMEVQDYDDIDRIQEIVAAQHIVLHDDRVIGRGMIIDKSNSHKIIGHMRKFITEVALVNPPLENEEIDLDLFEDANTRTLATVELMRGLSGGLMTLVGYPKFVAIGSVDRADTEVNSLSQQQKDVGLSFAMRAISLSWRNSNIS